MSGEKDAVYEAVSKRLERWRDELVDLSRRNPLISFKPSRGLSTWIESPSIDKLLIEGGKSRRIHIPMPTEEDSDDADGEGAENTIPNLPYGPEDPDDSWVVLREKNPERIYKAVERLASRERSDFDDKGLRTLYLAIGFLRWKDPKADKEILSPLILAPIEIFRENPRSPHQVRIVDDEETVVNPALTLKLREDLNLKLSDDWDWEDKPVEQELSEIEEALRGIEGLSVERNAAIGRFNFQKLVMYRDLGENSDRIVRHPMVKALVTGEVPDSVKEAAERIPDEEQLDDEDDPSVAASILDADASQRQCIVAARRGASMVIKGPPGTGKSQTIANLIAELMASGKSVLFVSEKLAALDVVYGRLAEAGIADYVLRLHGSNANRKEVVQQLADSLSLSPKPGRDMPVEDVSTLAELRYELNATNNAIHEPRPLLAGRSLFAVNGVVVALGDFPRESRVRPETLTEGREAQYELNSLTQNASELLDSWNERCEIDFPWRGIRPVVLSESDINEIAHDLEIAERALEDLRTETETAQSALGIAQPEEVHESPAELAGLIDRLSDLSPVPADWLRENDPDGLMAAFFGARERFKERSASTEAVSRRFPRSENPMELLSDSSVVLAADLPKIERNIGVNFEKESCLVDDLESLKSFVDQAPPVLARMKTDSAELASALGEGASRTTFDGIDSLVELGKVALTSPDDSRPLGDWLEVVPRQRARNVAIEFGPKLLDFQTLFEQATATWKPDALEIDAAALLERFEIQYAGKSLKFLNSAYRADSALIKKHTKNAKVPDQPVAALNQLVECIDARTACREYSQASVMGRFFEGERTNLEKVDQALDIADRCSGLASPQADLRQLASVVSEPDTVALEARTALDRLIRAKQELLNLASSGAGRGQQVLERNASLDLDGMSSRLVETSPILDRTEARVRDMAKAMGQQGASVSQFLDGEELLTRDTELSQEIDHLDQVWAAQIGSPYEGADTDWVKGAEAIEALRLVRSQFQVLPDELIGLLSGEASVSWPDSDSIRSALSRGQSSLESIKPRFQSGAERLDATSPDCLDLVRGLRATTSVLRTWALSEIAFKSITELGWGEVVGKLASKQVPESQVVPALTGAFWTERLDLVMERIPELSRFSGKRAQDQIEKFRKLDRELIKSGTARVRKACNSLKPDNLSLPGSETRTISREARKKKRFMPVRRLLRSVPEVLPKLKPCIMMSPLTVSHFLSGSQRFDVVIFDEASQIKPEDAINAIYRGDQLIVAGDDKQLPPTTFFDRNVDDSQPEDDEVEEGLESLLDEALIALAQARGEKQLRWHYRSRHQDLIAFSNDRFYGGSLFIFASPSREKSVKFHYVEDGVYDRGASKTNRIEANCVVDRLIELLREGERSVGVVALNRAQADAISDEMARRQVEDRSLDALLQGDRLSGVFVKNLETVQGDERDRILLSVGYGKDAAGKFYQGFGPLNGQFGPRRLNVAVTRARLGLEVFASVRPEDFDPNSTSSGGKLLRSYIDYAIRGTQVLAENLDPAGGETESPFEDAVLGEIRALGYEVTPQVGVAGYRIDLAVTHPARPGEFVLGVECDGATYHSSQVARDRDRLRESVLRGLGWEIHRIWSTDWRFSRREQIDRLRLAIEQAISPKVDQSPHEIEVSSSDERDLEPEPAGTFDGLSDEDETVGLFGGYELEDGDSSTEVDFADLSWTEPYVPADLSDCPAEGQFQDPSSSKARRRVLRNLVELEGPITKELAAKRLAEHWGIGRMGRLVEEATRISINQVVRKGHVESRGGSLWVPGQKIDAVRIPLVADAPERDLLNEVPDEEIDLAISKLREIGLEGDDLVAAVRRLFGYRRAGNRLRSRIQSRMGDDE